MKTGLHKTYPYRADFYDFQISQNADSGAISQSQVFDHTLPCLVITDDTGRLIIRTTDELRVGGRLMNVRDRNDAVLFPAGTIDGAQFIIDWVEPELNVFGVREGWVYAANRVDLDN